ncbi:uncharacterized mitochondrial protein AtMg00810-like [Telopea speciosissima]|uniref:uncharacterized mitochondrial protein AtMg00810-like n=1 Tax=Telopea speciosissima TaxID=54955 RepID=UPI001CC772FB|nr:uncharacterized mitochondrial protein AtMg00810-like [Telopea speciosissima]
MKFILDLLKETGMLGCKPTSSSIEQNHKLGEDCGRSLVDAKKYQKLVGKLIYLSMTLPDISYAMGVVTQFMYTSKSGHLDVVYQYKYLKSSPRQRLLYVRHNHLRIEGFAHANWAGSISDRRSTSGYCIFVGGNWVIRRSKKQPVVARSCTEVEFKAMTHGVCELIWLR